MAQKLPKALHRYFWDVNPDNIDLAKNRRYVIERLLELGDPEAVSWMKNCFSQDEIVQVLKNARALTKKSANFWANIFGISRHDLACFSKQSQETSNIIWNR